MDPASIPGVFVGGPKVTHLHPSNSPRADLLCIVPPYPVTVPPAGPAALIGYLKASGIDSFGFLDLRLWTPQAYAVTYSHLGPFGQSFAMDIPDLPLVLMLLNTWKQGRPLSRDLGDWFTRYCLDRAISPTYLSSWLASLDRLAESAAETLHNPDLVGFTVWTSNYLTTLMTCAHLKRRPRPPFIVLGGPQVTESVAAAQLSLMSGLADCVALGEGEETLRCLAEGLDRRTRTIGAGIPGTMTYDAAAGKFHSTPRGLLKLATLPLPDFEEMDLGAYQAGNSHRRILPFQLSRGCTDKCTFCSEWQFWERYRADGVDHVLENAHALQTRYGAHGLAFTDSLLNGVPDRLRQFAEGLLRQDARLLWGGFMRARMDRETAKLLRRAGFILAFIGIESFADETLQIMNKRRTMTDNIEALESFLSAGIAVRAGFIPGFPGDSRERFLATAGVFQSLQQKYPGLLALSIEPFVVSPGQPIFKNLAASGLEPAGWSDEYLDIAPRYRPVSERVVCTVDGPNQGIERLGQFQIAVALSQHGSASFRTTQAASNITRADFMYYSYNPVELLSNSDFWIENVVRGVYSGSFKTDQGAIYSCLLSDDERERYLTLEGERRIERPWDCRDSLLSRSWFEEFLADIECAHIVAPKRIHTNFVRAECLAGGGPGAIRLSPFVVARRFELHGKDFIVVYHTVSRRVFMLPAGAAAVLRQLDTASQSAAARYSTDGDIDSGTLALLTDAGFILAESSVAAASDGA
jgi:radical SAM superfamily enzyme YgiQ (UPF0313 family)